MSLASCGGDEVNCGAGTVLEGDTCVPEATCGTGTTLMDGECVPDGSVICEQGTRFDMATGTCVVDPSACADGTVLVGGECVPEDDTLTADHDEDAEPNDAAGAGEFNVPALNEDVTIHGCITPRAGVRDEDVWIMTAAAPTLVEITADGVGGLAAGFIVQDLSIASLPNYTRFGINLTGDTSKRQVYLPAAGTYLLVMDDSRALLLDDVAGGPDTCYYTTIKSVALPAATPLTLPTSTGSHDGNVKVFSFTADAEGDILRVVQTTTSSALSPAFVVMRSNAISGSPAAPITNPSTGAVTPPTSWQGGMTNAEVTTIIVDNQYDLSANPSAYTLTGTELGATALPTTGTTATVTTLRAAANPLGDPTRWNYLYFDVPAAGAVINWNLTSTLSVDMMLLRRNLFTISSTGGLGFSSFANINALGTTDATVAAFQGAGAHTRFLTAGRYYLAIVDPTATAAANTSVMITATLTTIPTPALTYGTAATAQALPATGAGFHTIDFTNPTWVEFAATGTADWGTNINVNLYDLAGEGIIGSSGYPAAAATSRVAAGTNPAGRIMVGEMRDFLVRVTSAGGTPGAAPTYELNIRTRPHIAVTGVAAGTPVNRTADAVAAGSDAAGAQNATRYLLTGSSFERVALTATPATAQNSNVNIRWLLADEGVNGLTEDDNGDGGAETINASFMAFPTNWAAFTIGSSDTEASTVDANITALAPQYSTSTGTLAYSDACTGGGAAVTLTAPHASLAGDEAQSAVLNLPAGWSFPFFGAAQTQFYVNSNGFLGLGSTLAPCGLTASLCQFTNGFALNANDVNGWVAPYWDDLLTVSVCRKDDATANTMTIQWTGNSASGAVQAQAVLHMNGRIDVIYGPGHVANGGSATVGIEGLPGNVAYQTTFNQTGIAASTSRTFTPAP